MSDAHESIKESVEARAMELVEPSGTIDGEIKTEEVDQTGSSERVKAPEAVEDPLAYRLAPDLDALVKRMVRLEMDSYMNRRVSDATTNQGEGRPFTRCTRGGLTCADVTEGIREPQELQIRLENREQEQEEERRRRYREIANNVYVQRRKDETYTAVHTLVWQRISAYLDPDVEDGTDPDTEYIPRHPVSPSTKSVLVLFCWLIAIDERKFTRLDQTTSAGRVRHLLRGTTISQSAVHLGQCESVQSSN